MDLYNKHIPLKTIKVKSENDWMNNIYVRQATEKRDMASRAYFELGSESSWKIFCKCRNKLKSCIRRARAKHFDRFFPKIE